MWSKYLVPESIEEALEALNSYLPDVRIIAGGTDLMRDIDAGICDPAIILDISGIQGFHSINRDEKGDFHIGPQTTHGNIASDPLVSRYILPLAQGCLHVGSPQIRNRGTLIGNVMAASPAADTLPVLFIMDAEVILQSQDRGIRSVPITRFFRGPKRTVVEPDELVTEIKVRSMKSNERGCFLKLADRQAMGISIVNVAVRVQYTHENMISDVRIALGSVGPTIMRAYESERRLMGEKLSEGVICDAVSKVHLDISPISDIRGTAEYRTWMAEVLVRRALELIQSDGVKNTWSDEVVTLSIRDHDCNAKSAIHEGNSVLEVNINGKDYSAAGGFKKSLLHLIRDDVGLTGTKKGCAEGRCGACTVVLDGQAVLSCLIPAANAHKREVVTIEGLANIEDSLPLRNAFVAEGAVQCGYCTPGFMMSAFALQQSEITPTHKAITEALAGNLCRCTGYTRILSAVEKGISKQTVSIQS